jgi:hypothetical protein
MNEVYYARLSLKGQLVQLCNMIHFLLSRFKQAPQTPFDKPISNQRSLQRVQVSISCLLKYSWISLILVQSASDIGASRRAGGRGGGGGVREGDGMDENAGRSILREWVATGVTLLFRR